MTFANWCLFLGMLLLIMSVSDSLLQKIPFSAAAIYMFLGVAAGPLGFKLLNLRISRPEDAHLVEMMTEIVVLISLFAVGLKLPVRRSKKPWKTPVLLATVAMMITIALTTAVGLSLGWSLGMALLIGSVLAPTDPVLASEVQVSHGEDRDALRFGLTAEGGLNDGTAFPFAMLALGLLGHHELGAFGVGWFARDVLWAVVGGICIGWLCGAGFTSAVMALRKRKGLTVGMESFLALGLIAATYGLSVHAGVYGFLAVFVAGLGMRNVEQEAAMGTPVSANQDGKLDLKGPKAEVTRIALNFAEDLEKFAEMAAMLVIGSLLTLDIFTWENAALMASVLFVIRPISILITTLRSDWSKQQRRIGAWFGIRGVGSIYYLVYALTHGLGSNKISESFTRVVLLTVASSVVLHGISATPIMTLYKMKRWRR